MSEMAKQEMVFMTRDRFSKLKKTVGEPYLIEQLGGYVNIKKWSGTERAMLLTRVDDVYQKGEEVDGYVNMRKNYIGFNRLMAEAVAMSLCDEDGNTMYDSTNGNDVYELEHMDADILQAIYEVCADRNGFLSQNQKEELKNLDATQS